jgi:serine/threonine protein kinase
VASRQDCRFHQEQPVNPYKPGKEVRNNGNIYTIETQIEPNNNCHIYYCKNESGKQLVAKVQLSDRAYYARDQHPWELETTTLKNVKHTNIIQMIDHFEQDCRSFIIMERCDTSLDKFMKNSNLYSKMEFKNIAKDILQGLDRLHNCGYMHNDIREQNILVSGITDENNMHDIIFKIADFGNSCLESKIDQDLYIINDRIRPPEVLEPKKFGIIDSRSDIYQIGLLFLTLIRMKSRIFTPCERLRGAPGDEAASLTSPYKEAILRSLSINVQDRFSSASAFLSAIQQSDSESI